jgi:hypothetical protein
MRIVTLDCEIKEIDPDWNQPETLTLSVLGIGGETLNWYSPDELLLGRKDTMTKTQVQRTLDSADLVISFNGEKFDFQVLETAGFDMTHARQVHYDLLVEFALASSNQKDSDRFPYNGDWVKSLLMNKHHRISLDGMCKALGIPPKTGTGADAPKLWKSATFLYGQTLNLDSQTSAKFLYNAVIDYCLNDVSLTKYCLRVLQDNDGMITYFNKRFDVYRTIRLHLPNKEI